MKILPIKASKSLKKWTFGPKKWRFIQILLYWWFNQEWSFICVDTVGTLNVNTYLHIPYIAVHYLPSGSLIAFAGVIGGNVALAIAYPGTIK